MFYDKNIFSLEVALKKSCAILFMARLTLMAAQLECKKYADLLVHFNMLYTTSFTMYCISYAHAHNKIISGLFIDHINKTLQIYTIKVQK